MLGTKSGVTSFIRRVVVVFLAGVGALRAAEDMSSAAGWPEMRRQTFEMVWSTVDEAYFDPTFGGVNWKGVGEAYRKKLLSAGDKNELRVLLREMLGQLKRTHFDIIPREATVFTPAERTRIGTIGAGVAWAGADLVFSQVTPDLPAAQAGIRLGDCVTSVDGRTMAELREALVKAGADEAKITLYLSQMIEARMQGAVGEEIRFRGRRGANEEWEALVKFEAHRGTWSEPVGNFPSQPLLCKSERSDDGIGYLQFSAFAPAIMKDVRKFLKSLKPGDGLIIDLRGNPGGLGAMAPGISGWLMDREVLMGTMNLRKGKMTLPIYPQDGAFLGPIAVLIDGESASTSEIMAAGLRDLERARLFGEHSAGAALPSAFKTLPTGDLFQFAIADVRTPKGASLEGNGVQPDEVVTLVSEDLVSGKDSVRAAAQTWLVRERRRETEGTSQKPSGH